MGSWLSCCLFICFHLMVVCRHEDGSLKFWHTTGEHLQILYKLKTGRHFERSENYDGRDVSHGIADLVLCLESRLLVVCSQSSQITLFHFAKNEGCNEISVRSSLKVIVPFKLEKFFT